MSLATEPTVDVPEVEDAGRTARERVRRAGVSRNACFPGAEDGNSALEAWQRSNGAQWMLVDSFEQNGRRYIVACENRACPAAFRVLTERERQVVRHAAFGFTNKEIGQALRISHSTVRVLMARAARKIGVRSRADLLLHPSLREPIAAE